MMTEESEYMYHTWTIENINENSLEKFYSSNSAFFPRSTQSAQFQLSFLKCHDLTNFQMSIRCYYSDIFEEIETNCTLNVVDINDMILLQRPVKSMSFTNTSFMDLYIFTKEELNNCFRDDTIRFQIVVELTKRIAQTKKAEKKLNIAKINTAKINTMCKLTKDLETLLYSPRFSDFCIQVGNAKYSVHKNILASRSPVFSDMLESNFFEKNVGLFEIKDLDKKTVNSMLRFIYTSQINVSNSYEAQELFIAAVKYKLTDLKSLCEKYLLKNIDEANVLDVLILADSHDVDQLKVTAVKYFVENIRQFSDETRFERILKEAPYLTIKLLTEVSKRTA